MKSVENAYLEQHGAGLNLITMNLEFKKHTVDTFNFFSITPAMVKILECLSFL